MDGIKYAVFTDKSIQLLGKNQYTLEQDLISNSKQIGIHLSTDFFLPFELISIILLVALIEFLWLVNMHFLRNEKKRSTFISY